MGYSQTTLGSMRVLCVQMYCICFEDAIKFTIGNYCKALNFKCYVLNKSYCYKKKIHVIQTFNVE